MKQLDIHLMIIDLNTFNQVCYEEKHIVYIIRHYGCFIQLL
jgi:hypothetical protein